MVGADYDAARADSIVDAVNERACSLQAGNHPATCSRRLARMITVANRLYVKPEYADAFETVFRERAGLVDKMEGFIANQILRPVNDGDPYVVFTTWHSRQDFLKWVRSDAFVKGHAQSGTLPKDAYFKTNVLELHEVLQDSSRPDLAPEPHGGPFNMH